MLKQVYRVLILIGIFVASLYYFSRDIKEVVFDIDNTTVMEETTFPLVTIRAGGSVINLLHGYSSNLDANKSREGITPLGPDQSFEVIINQEGYDIKKLNYELRGFNGNELIESDSVSVFEENGEDKTAKLKLKTPLSEDREYAVKITLITSESKKIYFYQRVKLLNNAYLGEKLSFVMSFHNAIKDKSSAEWIKDRLETEKNQENTTLARVNIHSSFDLVTWGNLKPEFLTTVVPTVIEINSELASIELKYMIRAEIAGAPEIFEVKEFYRVQYMNGKTYLLNYDRSMEAMFDVNLASVTKSQLKLGISSEEDVPYLASQDQKKIAFVRNRELWFYDLEQNDMVRVFSFRQQNTDYIRDLYDQHDIRILNMDAEGNLDFLVYGYMNRGQYEGKVGLVLYRYIRAENRIEERVYIPVDEPYQVLKENLGSFAYVSSLEVFYFHLYDNFYAYNLITGQLDELASGIGSDQIVYIKDKASVAWQGNPDPALSKNIVILNLETGKTQTIDTRTGYNILLLDMIDSNLVYGFVVDGEVTTLTDGRTIAPMNMLEIATIDRQILKNYSKTGYYVTGVTVKENIIELDRVERVNDNGTYVYKLAPQDYIMNQIKNEKPLLEVTSRVTEQALTELYLTLPAGFTMEKIPEIKVTVNTVISRDPTLRLQKQETAENLYYTYIAGEITEARKETRDAIEAAAAGTGVVLDSSGRLVWESTSKSPKNTIPGYDGMAVTRTDQSVESCIGLLLKQLGKGSGSPVSLQGKSIYETLAEKSGKTPVRLTGITLEQALYYITVGKPVIAMTGLHDAVLIYGCDNFNISVVDPLQGKTRKIGLQDSKEMFEGAGNVFISYLEE